jgi:glutathione transport system permease protein
VLAADNILHPSHYQLRVEAARLGLHRPAVTRYLHWLAGALHGNFGTSWATGRTVAHEFGIRIGATLVLTTAAFGMSLCLALILALVSAWAPGRWPDTISRAVTLGFMTVPSFLFGTLLIDLIVIKLGNFEVITNGHWDTVFLPALTLSLGTAGPWARILRASLLEASGSGYLDVATARGAGRLRRLLVHALPNSLVPFLTAMAVGLAGLLGGAAIVETVFSWPGVGAFFVQSISAQDIPVIQGFTLFAICAYVVMSTLVDIATVLIDPRLRTPSIRRRRTVLTVLAP